MRDRTDKLNLRGVIFRNGAQERGMGHRVEPALLQTKGYLIPAGAAGSC